MTQESAQRMAWWILFFSLLVFTGKTVLKWVGGPKPEADQLVAAVAIYLLLKDEKGMS